jgi:ribonucleoside-diphosphate reductase beta chain
MSTVFNEKKNDHTKSKMFLDPAGSLGIQRYETVKYKTFDNLTDKLLGFFWRPEEVSITKDTKDFRDLTVHEQHIFTSNIKRQTLLDSVQGRSPNLAFLPIVTIPELEAFVETWSFNETIHSKAYTHVIRNIYSDPSKVFDELLDIKEIVTCADTISKCYDELLNYSQQVAVKGYTDGLTEYEHKRLLWLAIMSVNILEGIRFYVSFACSWAFAELKKMEGNAKIIKFICRDENVHLAATQQMLKLLPTDDKDFAKIAEENREVATAMFVEAIEQEKAWAEYLFKDGSMIGLNAELLKEYVGWIGSKRMKAVGLTCPYKTSASNPLPWTEKWISGGDVQVAPQETEISAYIIGGVNQDVTEDTFKGFSL